LASNAITNVSAIEFGSACPVSATDNCGILTITYDPPSGSEFPVGTTPVTVSVTDVHGNTSTCSFDVIVNDTEDPVVNCKNLTVYLDATGNATISAAQLVASSSDNCGIASTLASDTDFTCADICPDAANVTYTDATGTFGPGTAFAQTFTSAATGPLTKVRLPIGSGSPITLDLINGGNPFGSILATVIIPAGPVEWKNIYFPMPPQLLNGNQYTLKATGTGVVWIGTIFGNYPGGDFLG
jgi:hypothetical protein